MVKKSLLLLVVLLFGCGSVLKAQNFFDFEDGEQGWTSIDADGDGNGWYVLYENNNTNQIPGHSGIGHMNSASYSGAPLTPDNYMVSPAKGACSEFSFWACAQDAGYAAEHFGVAISTTGNTDAADFTTIQEWTMTAKGSGVMSVGRDGGAKAQGNWYKYTVDLSTYAGQDIWVAIRHFDCTDMFRLVVDDVKISNQIIIDFETGDFSQYEFTNSTLPWVVVEEDGNHYAKSGNGGQAGTTSTLSCSHVFAADGYIAFDYNCMGEGSYTFWDHCDFIIDGTTIFTHGADHQGWDFYIGNVTAGSHTFTWSYTKDSSVDPTGDYFAIDNIVFGEGAACIAPNTVRADGFAGGALVSWNGMSDSYTLGYKPVSSSSWTTVSNITVNSYAISGLDLGEYDVRVQSDCAPGEWATASFTVTVPAPLSTANWYGYSAYADELGDKFVTFSMQNITTVTEVMDPGQDIYAAEYANGYVWFIGQGDGALYKAALDNEAQTIGMPMQVVSGFCSATATEMSYNPVDGLMYFIASSSGSSTLNSFDPANPTAGATTICTNDEHFYAFAINSSGVAYGIQSTGDLFTINLTTGAATLVGPTGVECSYVQTMAFDPETNELFWAQILDASSYGLYSVDVTTGAAGYIGVVGSVYEFTGLFGVYGSTAGSTIDDVMVEGFVAPQYDGHPNFSVSTPSAAHYSVQSVNWYKNGVAMTTSDVFNDESANYYMVVDLAAESGYEFGDNVSVFFNGDLSVYDAANSSISGGVLHARTITYQVVNATMYTFDDNTMEGWTTIDADGDGYTWVLGSQCDGIYLDGGSLAGSGHNSSADLVTSGSYSNVVGVLYPDNFLVSPTKEAYTYIHFYACAQDASYPAEHFGVAVSTAGNTSASDFVMIDEWTMTAKRSNVEAEGRGGQTRQGTWYEYTANLSAYAGQEFWLAIRHFDCSDMFLLNVDDIELASSDAVGEYPESIMTIYPNPAKDRMMVESEVVVNEYRIYDVTGAEIMSNKVNSDVFEVNVNNLSTGVYYIRIYSDGLIQSKKFVVE